MAILKYFARTQALLAADRDAPDAPLPPFDFESLGSKSALARGATRFLLRRILPAIVFLLRQVWPNPRFGRVVVVTRAADVTQVLKDMAHFKVVYREEMRALGGSDNVLSVDDAEHGDLRTILERSLRLEDIGRVSVWAQEDAEALLAAGAGRIDVIRDLVTRTATEAACRLFGITSHDPDAFAQWTMAVSNQLFGDFSGDENVHCQAKIGSAHLRAAIDNAIARVNYNNVEDPHSARHHDTVIDRLLTVEKVDPASVRAVIIGLVTAFVPTNTLAAGNILEVLLDKRQLWDEAVRAAVSNDAAAMRQTLLEAGRLNPALSPGLWRHVPTGGSAPPIGTGWRARSTRAGDLILACIPSALRDGRGLDGSGTVEARRWMMFGVGPHDCVGAELALAHLVSVFTALLRLPELHAAPDQHGRMRRTGAFPMRLDMVYASPRAKRAMIVAALPVRTGISRRQVEEALDALGNPARGDVADTLRAGDRVQFASLSVIERATGSPESILLLEVSGDGDEKDLLGLIARQCHGWLAPIVGLCRPATSRVAKDADLADILRDAYFKLDQSPHGNTGLHFDGMAELSVADVARQEKVARLARFVIDRRLKRNLGLNTRAMGLLLRTKRLMRGDEFLGMCREDRRLQRLAALQGLRGALLRPSRKRLAIADWKQPPSLWPGIKATLLAPENRFVAFGALALVGIWLVVLLAWWSRGLTGPGEWLLAFAVGLVAAVALAAATLLGTLALLAWGLRHRETRDSVDDRSASIDDIQAVTRREDAPRCVQNHILAVMAFKPGPLRRLSFAFAMWGICQSVRFFFRPGFVVTMGTIHKARWLRVPGTEQFVFLSNYDGSWESYLEDFITRAHEGQSAAWSHGIGFPKTRFLVLDGAADGDRFKRWVRLHQRETRFWFTRFPHLTAQHIRNNAVIEDGLARATSDTDARRWLACFGSAQREAHELEAEEAQSIAFSGLPRMAEATTLLLRLPTDEKNAGKWLSAVSGLEPRPGDNFVHHPPPRWIVKGRSGSRIHLPHEARVLFGDQSWDGGGAMLGFTAGGLRRLGLDAEGGFDSLPAAFRMSMAARTRLLGDGAEAPAGWRFSDGAGLENGADAILTLYGCETGCDHAELVQGHKQLLMHFGGSVGHEVVCGVRPLPNGSRPLETEPFGFRDGISQPVLRGSRKSARPVPASDLIAAGEILLGYRNEQGHLPPPITVGAERDPACELPTVSAAETTRYPWYGTRSAAYEPRDFGRNGSFLAVRQLDQDVAGFWTQAERICQDLRFDYPEMAELPGSKLSPTWVAARIIGRWPNGTPLVGHPDKESSDPAEVAANDFAYGTHDPRGLACPLGAHIRRTNPRDSQEPGDADEQRITNRHRMLRRGRSYNYAADGAKAPKRDGLLFMALCADLERQFEFVQRTWINSTTFHGLMDEKDPLLGASRPPGSTKDPGYFTIPTAVGPIRIKGLQSFVTVRGGGYFFLPSRSAIAHLITRSQAAFD